MGVTGMPRDLSRSPCRKNSSVIRSCVCVHVRASVRVRVRVCARLMRACMRARVSVPKLVRDPPLPPPRHSLHPGTQPRAAAPPQRDPPPPPPDTARRRAGTRRLPAPQRRSPPPQQHPRPSASPIPLGSWA